MLIYGDNFFEDPRRLANGLLRRTLDAEKDWPCVNGSLKRSHVRDILLDLADRQGISALRSETEPAPASDDATPKVRTTSTPTIDSSRSSPWIPDSPLARRSTEGSKTERGSPRIRNEEFVDVGTKLASILPSLGDVKESALSNGAT